MKIINNITEKLSDELKQDLRAGSRLSIAAACFSVYAFEELKTQLLQINALRFIFTSPTFLAEQPKQEQREFISRGATEKRRCTAASLKFACAMRLRSVPSPKNVPTGFGRKRSLSLIAQTNRCWDF